jgi:hypothetical protein
MAASTMDADVVAPRRGHQLGAPLAPARPQLAPGHRAGDHDEQQHPTGRSGTKARHDAGAAQPTRAAKSHHGVLQTNEF